MQAVIQAAIQPKEQHGSNESANGIDEVMRLNIDCCAAKQEVYWEHHPKEPFVFGLPCQHHGDGAHAHVATWECSSGTFSHFLCANHQLAENAFDFRCQHLRVSLKVVSDRRKFTCGCCFEPYSLKVILRTRHRQKFVDDVEHEE